VQRIVDSAIKGASSIYSSGIEPGFGCDLLAVAMASMSNRIYSIRGLEITDYSPWTTPSTKCGSCSVFGQPIDYQGGIMMPGVIKYRLGRGGHHGRRSTRRTTRRDSRIVRVRTVTAPP